MNSGSHIFRLEAGGALQGKFRVPGDKSISHRAVMLGAMACGETQVMGFLEGQDCRSTLRAFHEMGVKIEPTGSDAFRIHGVGLNGLQPPKNPLDLGNSGTSMRLLAGLMAGQNFETILVGDESLSRRPMRRIAEPLRLMGAQIDLSGAGTAPIRIHGGSRLRGIVHESPVASAQIKSAVLLAGLYATGTTCVIEPSVSRDHTERMLQAFGIEIEAGPGFAALHGGQRLHGSRIVIPGDISSAAFFMVGAAIAPGSDILLESVGLNPTRRGIIEILDQMGADISVINTRMLEAEPVADLRVRGSRLRGIEIGHELVTLAIDEMPAVFIAAACAQGETIISGAGELRVKESDRIQAMCEGLQRLDIDVQPRPDGARIIGGNIGMGTINSFGDHRIAMAFAMAALRASGPLEILDCANVSTSFPGFADLAQKAGLKVEQSVGIDGNGA